MARNITLGHRREDCQDQVSELVAEFGYELVLESYAQNIADWAADGVDPLPPADKSAAELLARNLSSHINLNYAHALDRSAPSTNTPTPHFTSCLFVAYPGYRCLLPQGHVGPHRHEKTRAS